MLAATQSHSNNTLTLSSSHLVFHHQQLRGQNLVLSRHQYQILCYTTHIDSLMTYLITKQMMILILMMIMIIEIMVESWKHIGYKVSHNTKS